VTFAHPALAILAALSFPAAFLRQRIPAALRRSAYAYSNLPFMAAALKAPEWPNVALDLACAVSFSLLVAGAAGPRLWTTAPVPAALAFCLDTSGSMNARDIVPSRAAAAALAIRSSVNAMPSGTRAGLVSFAGDARRIIPLTGERDAIIAGLARIPPPNGQTAIGDGLLAAAALLPNAGPRAIVLITDGANNHGEDPRDAVRTLGASHIRLNAIVLGSAPFPEQLRSNALETGGTFSRPESAADLTVRMVRLATAGFAVRVPHDCTEPCVLAALSLGAAAWLAAAGAARR
jgi:Ca-activated chloride channel family protein